jgi:adenylate cyclase
MWESLGSLLVSFRNLRRRPGNPIFTAQHPWRRLRGGMFVGGTIGIVLALMIYQNFFSGIRTQLTDSLYGPRPTDGITAIIAIDDASLAAYGRTPAEWPRSVHTQLIKFLSDAGARVIAFDVLFADPTPYDSDLAAAMSAAGNVIEPVAGGWTTSKQTTKRGNYIQYDKYDYPTPILRDAAVRIGHVNIVPDQDGQVRQVPLVVKDGDQYIPALGLAAYMQYIHYPPQLLEVSPGHVKFAGRDLTTDDIGQMMVYYFGPPTNVNQPGTYPVYSFVDVVNGKVPADTFTGKIVLIGALDAQGSPDSYATPSTTTGKKMYGVEIHANIIETIDQSLPTLPLIHDKINWKLDFGPLGTLQLVKTSPVLPLRPTSTREQMMVTFLIALLAGALLPFLRWYVGLVVTPLAYVAYFAWASTAFSVWGHIEELLFPGMALGFTYVGTLIVIYVFEERRRGQINDLFSRYVSAEIAQKIVEAFDKGQLELGGEEREITVLFADVRGFTTLSEGLTPPEVVHILNIFLEQMTSIVMQYGGAINKYIGDNMMAFWNAPYSQEDHAWLATQAALGMLEEIRKINETGQFTAPVQFGIGINTGPVVVGNVGSQRRTEYTPIGDTVNVASRLCGVAPGGVCYIGARTRELLGDRVKPTDVLHLKLKGKAEPVEIHELHPASSMAETVPGMQVKNIVES